MIDKTKAIADIRNVLASSAGGGVIEKAMKLSALAQSCVERWAPKSSAYQSRLDMARGYPPHTEGFFQAHHGVLRALLEDVEHDRLLEFEELMHASTFRDLLGQAEYFVGEGYLLPAAVMAGGVLEGHLRALAVKSGLPLDKGSAGASKPKNAGEINQDLYNAKVYLTADLHLVQGWLDLRNEAAHNKPEFRNRTGQEIEALIGAVRFFISKYPA
ncbi:MAG TPA: hypothetical protein PLC99_20025 [Verrucomicrobiota bacterium]|nr:hypothetical protein [Verrucomicrobiota bacterium]